MAFYRSRSTKKYGNKKTVLNGIEFSSMLEASLYSHLISELYKKANNVKAVECQPKIYLTDAKILMKPDFKIIRNDETFYFVEAKGAETTIYKLKKKLWPHYASQPLHVYKGSARKIYLDEIINPVVKLK